MCKLKIEVSSEEIKDKEKRQLPCIEKHEYFIILLAHIYGISPIELMYFIIEGWLDSNLNDIREDVKYVFGIENNAQESE